MTHLLRRATVLCACLIGFPAIAGPIPAYPPATVPLTGQETVIGQQSGRTVEVQAQTIANLATVPASLPSRAIVPSIIVGSTSFTAGGYYVQGDLGAGCIYTVGSGGPQQVTDAAGVTFSLVVQNPTNVGCYGAHGDYQYAQGLLNIAGTTATFQSVKGPSNSGAVQTGIQVGMNVAGASPGTVITALGTGTGGNGTYAVNNSQTLNGASCTGASITGTTLTQGSCSGAIAIGAVVNGAAANTTVTANLGGGQWTVTPSQTLGSSTITTTVFGGAWSGHDDAAAFQAAAVTGQNYAASGATPSTSGAFLPTVTFGLGSTIPMTAQGQTISMSNATLAAYPGVAHSVTVTGSISPGTCLKPSSHACGILTVPANSGLAAGDYVSSADTPLGTVIQTVESATTFGLNTIPTVGSEAITATHPLLLMSGAREVAEGVQMEGQGQIGVAAAGVSTFGGSIYVHNLNTFHFSAMGGCMCAVGSQSALWQGGSITDVGIGDAQFADADNDWTAVNLLVASGDNRVDNMTLAWSKLNLLYQGGGGLQLTSIHPFNGCSGCAVPHHNAINIEQTADSNGTLMCSNLYLDDGSIEQYTGSGICRGIFIGSANSASLPPNNAFINIYANGLATPFGSNYEIAGPTSFLTSGDLSINYADNNSPVTLTGGTPEALTITGASNPDGSHVLYQVASWPNGQPSATITTAGNSVSGLNVTNAVVTASTPTSATIANATVVSGTFGTITGHVAYTIALFSQNNPKPATSAHATIAASPSGYVCSKCSISAVSGTGPFTVTVAQGGDPTAFASGTLADAWALDYSGVAALVTATAGNALTTNVLTAPLLIIQSGSAATGIPPLSLYAGNGPGPTIPFQVGTQTAATLSCIGTTLTGTGSTGNCTIADGSSNAMTFNVGTGGTFLGTNGGTLSFFGANGTNQAVLGPGVFRGTSSGSLALGATGVPLGGVFSTSYDLGAVLAWSSTAPTVAGAGSGATVAGNGTALVIVTAGTGPTTTETLTMPAATTGWGCTADDLTSAVTAKQTAASLTSTTQPAFTWSGAPTAGDKLKHLCTAY